MDLRVQPGDLTGNDLLPFVPRLAEINQSEDNRLLPLAIALAETVTIHGAATWAIENREWDFAAVCYPMLGRVSRHYMRYDGKCEIFGDVVRTAYRLQDAMLGRLLELAGSDASVMVVSEHGFLTGDLRPAGPPAADGDFWPRMHGIFCLSGPHAQPDELVHGANALDIVPTILALFDMPPAEDMPGRILAEALLKKPSLEQVPSYESEPQDADEFGSVDTLELLRNLGYSDPLSDQLRSAAEQREAGKEFALACVHLGAGRVWEAMPVLERVVSEQPDNEIAQLYLSTAYLIARRWDDCTAKLDGLVLSKAYEEFGALIRGRLLLAQRRPKEAIAHVRQVEAQGSSNPLLGCLLGDAYSAAQLPKDAERCYRAVVAKNADLAIAHVGLAVALLAQRRDAEAAEAALDATGLNFGLPIAHYSLGVALARTARFPEAVRALDRCVQLAPNHAAARRLLQRLRSKCA